MSKLVIVNGVVIPVCPFSCMLHGDPTAITMHSRLVSLTSTQIVLRHWIVPAATDLITRHILGINVMQSVPIALLSVIVITSFCR